MRRLVGSDSEPSLDFEKLSGFNRAERWKSKIEICSISDRVFAIDGTKQK